MEKEVEILLKHDFEYIKNSELCLSLLKIYSILYLKGGKPSSTCVNCMRKYYNEIKKTGLMKAKKEAEKTYTNKCKIKGVKYVRKAARHFDFSNLCDVDAQWLLDNDVLKESDFTTLPEQKQVKKKTVKKSKDEIQKN
jgi:hypothetical protein